MQNPLVSCIIPTFNRANYIAEAVESVLAQTYTPIELIVVDDGSTDDIRQILTGFPGIRYLWQENRGFAAARNAGIAIATGQFLSFLDSDDVWREDKIRRQMAVFSRQPETDAVYGQAEQFASPELSSQDRARFGGLDGKVMPMPTTGTLLIRRAAFDRVGLFDESLRIGVDMDWYARLSEERLKVAQLDLVLLRRRLHRSNVNLTHAHEQSERLHVLKKALDRRRKRVHLSD